MVRGGRTASYRRGGCGSTSTPPSATSTPPALVQSTPLSSSMASPSSSAPMQSTSLPSPFVGPSNSAPVQSTPLPSLFVGPCSSAPVQSTPLPSPFVGPSSSAPVQSTSLLSPFVGPSSSVPMQSTPLPPFPIGTSGTLPTHVGSSAHQTSLADDVASQHEGDMHALQEGRKACWILGDKVEPNDASRFISYIVVRHVPGPYKSFRKFPQDLRDRLYEEFLRSYQFVRAIDVGRAQRVWEATASRNYKHLLYSCRDRAQVAEGGSVDCALWKAHGPVWMRREDWEVLCDAWAEDSWREKSTKAKAARASHADEHFHTSGSVSFSTQKERLEKERGSMVSYHDLFAKVHKKKRISQYVSERARSVVDSYDQQMTEKYGEDGTQEQPQLDLAVCVAAIDPPKKGRVYGFGQSLDATSILASSASSTPACPDSSSFSAPLTAISQSEIRSIVRDEIGSIVGGIEMRIIQALATLLTQAGILTAGALSSLVQSPRDPPITSDGQDDAVENAPEDNL